MSSEIVLRISRQDIIYVGVAVLFFFAGFLTREAMGENWRLPEWGEEKESRAALMSGNVSLDDDPRLGSEGAAVRVVLFSEFDCPYSARAAPLARQLHDEYGEEIVIAFRDFPLGFHETAQKAAEAAECADEQGMFWEYHDRLFETQGAHDVADLKGYAAELGLDTAAFDSCLDSGEMEGEVAKDLAAGGAAGVSGTPTFFVNGEPIVGAQPFEVFQERIGPLLS